jgi:hypothetical protein
MLKQDQPPERLYGDGNALSTLRRSRENEEHEGKEIAYHGIDDDDDGDEEQGS